MKLVEGIRIEPDPIKALGLWQNKRIYHEAKIIEKKSKLKKAVAINKMEAVNTKHGRDSNK